MARPIATRWRWPPESWRGKRSSSGVRPRISAARPTFWSISALSALGQHQREGHVVAHRHVRVQRVVLEHHRDVALLGRHVSLTTRSPMRISPPRDLLEPGDHAQQRDLPQPDGPTSTAAMAAQRATRAQIAAIKRALAAIDTAEAEGRDGVDEDLAFHRAIGEATGNPQFSLLLGFFEQYLREGMRITRGNEARRKDFMEQVRNEHRLIVDAISRHDAAAARRCATRHIQHGERRLELGGVIVRQRAARNSTRGVSR
jgi:hypothetical protein